MRDFYLKFPILNALRSELSWTHYRLLLKVENDNARAFYETEAAAAHWGTRELERQINSFFLALPDLVWVQKDVGQKNNDIFWGRSFF